MTFLIAFFKLIFVSSDDYCWTIIIFSNTGTGGTALVDCMICFETCSLHKYTWNTAHSMLNNNQSVCLSKFPQKNLKYKVNFDLHFVSKILNFCSTGSSNRRRWLVLSYEETIIEVHIFCFDLDLHGLSGFGECLICHHLPCDYKCGLLSSNICPGLCVVDNSGIFITEHNINPDIRQGNKIYRGLVYGV